MVKKLSLVLAVLISFLVLFSCANEGEEKFEYELSPITGIPDLLGYNFRIAGEHRAGITEIAPVNGDAALSDMLLQHYVDVGEIFNMKITAFQGNDINGNIVRAVVSNLPQYADVIDQLYSTLYSLYAGGYLLPLNYVVSEEELYSGKYGTETMLEALSMQRLHGTDNYGFYPAYWGIPTPKFQNAGYFNHNLVKQFSQPDPFELIENGEWTWANFKEICLAVISEGHDPASPDDDTYGIAENPDLLYVIEAALVSNGVKFIEYDEQQGKYVTDVGSAASIETFEYVKDLYDSGALRMVSGSAGSFGIVIDDFMKGKSFFLVEYTYHGTTDRDSMAYYDGFEFSWIPFPQGPSNTNVTWGATLSNADRYLALPILGDNEDILQAVLPELFNPFKGLENTEWREYFASGMFFNSKSEDWFFIMYDNATCDYDQIIPSFFTSTYLYAPIIGNTSIYAAIDSYLDKAQAEIDTRLNSYLLK